MEVYICKSIVNDLRHGNYICKSDGNYRYNTWLNSSTSAHLVIEGVNSAVASTDEVTESSTASSNEVTNKTTFPVLRFTVLG